MIYIRSTLFHIAFFAVNLVLCLFYLWTLLLPRKWAWTIIYHGYFRPLGWLEKYILGLDFKVEGKENLPEAGPYIVAMKHQSIYETLKIFHLFGDIRIIFKRQLSWIPIWGWYINKVGMIPVDRGKKGAMNSVIENAAPVIAQGHSVLLYPQGTRVSINTTIQEKPYKQGVSRLYAHYQIPIVPVAMNAGKFWPKHAFLIKSGTVTFKILPPIPEGLPQEEAHQKLQDVLERESKALL
jgi:1-acyl-sn-glycerol-3-phosphate acyltransferase